MNFRDVVMTLYNVTIYGVHSIGTSCFFTKWYHHLLAWDE